LAVSGGPRLVRAWAGRLGLLAASIAASAAVAEAVMRALTPFPITEQSNKVEHPRLGYVLSREIPDVDARGFRNRATALEEAEIAVVGDSHTYGFTVAAEDSFPAVLSRKTGRRVYNLGIPAYGIYHYAVLLDELASHSVGDVLLALYPANDLANHCSVTTLPSWREFERAAGLAAPPCDGYDAARAARNREEDWLRNHSALASAWELLVWERLRPGRSYVFAHDMRVTMRRMRHYAASTRLANEDIARSFENGQRILADAHRRLRARGIRFAVLVIPSRERVLYEWSRRADASMHPDFAALVVNEVGLTDAFLAFFRAEGIDHLDAIERVVAGFDRTTRNGHRFYSHDGGHPAERGYAAYADAVAELLRRP
jgi:hypothetical protein